MTHNHYQFDEDFTRKGLMLAEGIGATRSSPTVSGAAHDATSRWRLLQCYNEVDGLAKLSARQIAQAANPPGLAPQRGTLQAFEHPRSKSCGAANPDRPGICGRRPWRGRSKACGERRQKEARFWSHFRISLVVPRTSSDACRLARSLILPVSCHVQEHPLHPGGRRPRLRRALDNDEIPSRRDRGKQL